MPEVQTESVNMALARELTIGVLPGSPEWNNIEPNDIGRFGKRNTLTQRNPISKDRMERAGVLTDAESALEWDSDFTMSAFLESGEPFCLANLIGPPSFGRTLNLAGAATGYDVDSGGALTEDTIIFARGFLTAANNGEKLVGVGSTAILIIAAGTVIEAAPPAGATVEVAGVRGATGDFEIDASQNLISTLLDFTTLNLTVGQIIHIGGTAGANRFALAENFGTARIQAIATNEITLENRSQAYSVDNGAGLDVDILFGRFLRPVATDSGDYNLISFAGELESPNLLAGGLVAYEYSRGNMINTIGFQIPLADKCTMNAAAIGTTTDDPVGVASRETNAADAASPTMTEGLSSSIDIARLRFGDFDTLGFGSCFKSLDIQISNNATPSKCISTLGAKSINIGTLNVIMNGEIALSDDQVIVAMNGNLTTNFDFTVRNADGGVAVDLPSMKLGGGDRSFPRNETVRFSMENRAFKDPILGYPISFSLFPVLPAA
jgi:hypothetical protein